MSRKGLELMRDIFKGMAVSSNFSKVASKCQVVDGGPGRCVCEMTVEEEHENPGGTLHGGLTATLVDIISTVALVNSPRAHPGVSVDLNVTYMRPAKHGETVVFDANVLRAGKSIAFTTVDVRRKSDNELLALARHTKAFPASKKE